MLNNTFFSFSCQAALKQLSVSSNSLVPADKAVLLIRATLFQQAEAEVLANVLSSEERVSLLLILRACQASIHELQALLDSPLSKDALPEVIWFARQKQFFLNADFNSVVSLGLPSSDQAPSSFWHSLVLASSLAWCGKISEAETLIKSLPNYFCPPEKIECEAHLALLRSQPSNVLEKLSPLLEEGNASAQSWEFSIHALRQLGEENAANTMLLRASSLFPHSYRLIGRRVLSSVLRRLPTEARRFALQERLLTLKGGWIDADRQRSQQNLAFAYENGGRADLLCALHPSVIEETTTWQLQAIVLSILPPGKSFL